MKRILLSIIISLFCLSLPAQNANRLTTTKIGDALNQLPAQNESVYIRLMNDIISTGDEGLNMLLSMLLRKDESFVPVQYAIAGLCASSTKSDFPASQRESIKNALLKTKEALPKDKNGKPDGTIEGFLVRQLMVMGEGGKAPAVAPQLTPKEAVKALKDSEKVAKRDPSPKNVSDRCVAIEQYIKVVGITEGEKEILKALKDPCRRYRFATLYAVGDTPAAPLYAKITALMPKLSDEAQADIAWWFGEQREKGNIPALLPLLESKNFELRKTAAHALTKIGAPETLPQVASLLTDPDPSVVLMGEEVLKSYPGDVASAVVPLLSSSSNEGKVAILHLIAQRKAMKHREVLLGFLTSDNTPLRTVAFKELKEVVTLQDLNMLYSLLEKCTPQEVPSVQEAIMSALSAKPRNEQYNLLVARKDAVSVEKQDLYWPMVMNSANILDLYNIILGIPADKSELFETAFSAHHKLTTQSGFTGAQKLLFLRKEMEFARTTQQKIKILESVATTDAFLGIIFAGEYIDDPLLQQPAAQAVRLIATRNSSFHGPEVTALLKRATKVIKGPDSGYEITAIEQHLDNLPKDEGFVSMFNGKDLTGWKGLFHENPLERAKVKGKELAKAEAKADEMMRKNWMAEDGKIIYHGKGYDNLCSIKEYGDFELYIDWLLYPEGTEADAGLYLRSLPQVQIWDTARVHVGAQVGSGGLYNNTTNRDTPLCVADNGLGQWNSFYIKMVGERVTVYLNGILVTDNVILENYWDRSSPAFPIGPLELQAHDSRVAYRNIYIRELPSVKPITLSAEEAKEGFDLLFDGVSLNKWKGNKTGYVPQNGELAVLPAAESGGDLYTVKEYGDFIFRFEFKLTHGANNGVGIRTPGHGDAAYEGMEIQILDHFNAIYQPWLLPYQYHGAVYGIISPTNFNALRPVGEWNEEEIYCKGTYIRITLNGQVITEGDIAEASKNGTLDQKEHPGLHRKSGYIGFLGHGSELWLRNIRIKELK